MRESDTFFLRISPPRAHLRAVGELDIAISRRLDHQLSAAIAEGCSTFSLDLGRVSFCDATTVSVIANLERTLRATDGSLDVVEASEHVRRVFRLVGLDGLIKHLDCTSPEAGNTDPPRV